MKYHKKVIRIISIFFATVLLCYAGVIASCSDSSQEEPCKPGDLTVRCAPYGVFKAGAVTLHVPHRPTPFAFLGRLTYDPKSKTLSSPYLAMRWKTGESVGITGGALYSHKIPDLVTFRLKYGPGLKKDTYMLNEKGKTIKEQNIHIWDIKSPLDIGDLNVFTKDGHTYIKLPTDPLFNPRVDRFYLIKLDSDNVPVAWFRCALPPPKILEGKRCHLNFSPYDDFLVSADFPYADLSKGSEIYEVLNKTVKSWEVK